MSAAATRWRTELRLRRAAELHHNLQTDFGRLQLRWFDHWLKGVEPGRTVGGDCGDRRTAYIRTEPHAAGNYANSKRLDACFVRGAHDMDRVMVLDCSHWRMALVGALPAKSNRTTAICA